MDAPRVGSFATLASERGSTWDEFSDARLIDDEEIARNEIMDAKRFVLPGS
jgi:hypothetical protein